VVWLFPGSAGLSRCRGWGAALVCPFRHLPRLTGEVGVQLALCLRTPTSGASLFGRSRSGWDIAVSLLHLGLSACGSLVHGWYTSCQLPEHWRESNDRRLRVAPRAPRR